MLCFAIAYGSVAASSNLYTALLDCILHAPISFFDTNPIGRIMNRFTKDMDNVDTTLPSYINLFMVALVPFLATIGIVLYSLPVFAVAFLPFGVVFLFIKVWLSITICIQWQMGIIHKGILAITLDLLDGSNSTCLCNRTHTSTHAHTRSYTLPPTYTSITNAPRVINDTLNSIWPMILRLH